MGAVDFSIDDIEEVKREIGPAGFERFRWLVHYLGERFEAVRFRYAPSIVTRSEAELWGLSQPRFAIRGYLPSGGFINLRRLGWLAKGVRTWSARQESSPDWIRLDDPSIREDSENAEEPKTIIERSSSVGDSLLLASGSIRKRFHVLDIDLGWCYGESEPVKATP